jgi:flagellar P-ring protein precursor FlgI
MLERLGVNIRGQNLNLKNVAAVMVTTNLPAFSTQGTRIDVTVSALGDAKNLQGGTLLVTPLLGADGNVYAVAQGSLAISGFQAEGDAARITRGVPTVGRIANGAIIERDRFRPQSPHVIRLALRTRFHHLETYRSSHQRFPRFATAEPLDPSTVGFRCPNAQQRGGAAGGDRAVADQPDLSAKIISTSVPASS